METYPSQQQVAPRHLRLIVVSLTASLGILVSIGVGFKLAHLEPAQARKLSKKAESVPCPLHCKAVFRNNTRQAADATYIDSQTRDALAYIISGPLPSTTCKDPKASADAFFAEGGPNTTRCPGGQWLESFAMTDPSPDKTIISIGCNKGIDFLSNLALWDHTETPFDIEPYTSALHSQFDNWAGACLAGIVGMREAGIFVRPALQSWYGMGASAKHNYRAPRGICVEPEPYNFNGVQHTMTSLRYDKPRGGRDKPIQLVHAALSSSAYPPFQAFPKCRVTGCEGHGLGSVGKQLGDFVQVRVTTGDKLLAEQQVSGDMLLFIDTEGNDARVIFGLVRTLAFGRVRYLEFEHHGVGDWASRASIADVIDLLDSFDFDCFWAMAQEKGLYRITGCWDDRYAAPRVWSNIACVSRRDKLWWPILAKLDRST